MEFSLIELVEENIRLIKPLRFLDKVSIPVWKTRTATYTVPIEYEDYSEWSEITLGTHWTCPYHGARWFEATVTIPQSYAGKRVVLELDLGGEGIVSINGETKSSLAHFNAAGYSPRIGTLRHRTRVDVTDCAEGGEVLNISVQLSMNFKDHFRGHRGVKYDDNLAVPYVMAMADLCAVDEEAEAYYYDVQNLYDAITLFYSPAEMTLNKQQTTMTDLQFDRYLRNMNRDSGLRSRMIEALQKSMAAIPFYFPADQMRAAIPEASRILHEQMDKLPRLDRGKVYATGFAHLDLVWLWQQKHSVRKAANTLYNALALMERYPDFILSFSQPAAFEWVEKYYPELFEKVKEKVASGNIDAIGNLWVEMDTNLASGEAIVRQLLYGRAYYLEKFGKASDVFFMPDSFGYSASLPQIIRKSGIPYFYTNKLQFNELYRFPYTFFQWQGIDGTKIPSYLQRCAYNGGLNCERVDEVYHRMENKRLSDTAFMTCGYGDGGGGADYVMLENAKRLKDMPGVPKVSFRTLGDLFKEVCEKEDEFPIWRDELYLDRHRGTYTSQGFIKKNNRRAELSLRCAEMAASLREILLGIPYPAEEFEKLWKKILFLQFHDSLPGSSNTFVNKDTAKQYAEFFEQFNVLYQQLLQDLTAGVNHDDSQPLNWNFLSWERGGIPSIGCGTAEKVEDAITVTPSHIENRFFSIDLDENGHLTSVLCKESGREALTGPSNVLEIMEDPAKGNLSAWDTQLEAYNVCTSIDDIQSITVGDVTSEKGSLRIVRQYHNSTITQDITVYADTPRIDFITHVDWHETMRMMKAAFYPKVQTGKAAYEIQFGTIERPTHRSTDYDQMRFEACGHKWADMSQSDFGVSLLNDCKYGHDIFDGKMRITLLRSGIEPDFWQDQGEHDFTYSLYPHTGTWATGGTVQAGYELNVPVEACSATSNGKGIDFTSFATVSSKNIVLDTIKKAEDGNGYILRLYEACGTGGNITIELCKDIAALEACNLMEVKEGDVPFSGNTFTFETSPYCIHTFRVTFN